jgi:tetratricopeptide (TPR) repeat protein
LGRLLSEKCELVHAGEQFSEALELARKNGDLRLEMEALSGLLRLAGEALDQQRMGELGTRLESLMQENPREVPPLAWYCRGAIERHLRRPREAQLYFHRYLREVCRKKPAHPHFEKSGSPPPGAGDRSARAELSVDRSSGDRLSVNELSVNELSVNELSLNELSVEEVRGWMMIAACFLDRGRLRRAELLAQSLWNTHHERELPAVNGTLQLILGHIAEARGDHALALEFYQGAHGAFLAERNWLLHLYALMGFARISRARRNFGQAAFQLDLIERAASGPEFGALRRELALERARLRDEAVDLVVDSDEAKVRLRDQGEVSFRKQFVLLAILEELSSAHLSASSEGGLSKGELIRRVWKENYRPEAHDNKLYYNINRLRKLIEPDVQKPRYLLNFKEGYRLAPGLKVRIVKTDRGGEAAG